MVVDVCWMLECVSAVIPFIFYCSPYIYTQYKTEHLLFFVNFFRQIYCRRVTTMKCWHLQLIQNSQRNVNIDDSLFYSVSPAVIHSNRLVIENYYYQFEQK